VLRYQARLPHELRWPTHDFVFVSELGEPLRATSVEAIFKRHLTKAGLLPALRRCRSCRGTWHTQPNAECSKPKAMDPTPHSLRHSTGTYLTAAGVPDRVIMAILGHSSPRMTARYQHVMSSMVASAAESLARVFPTAASG
jgi:integrase